MIGPILFLFFVNDLPDVFKALTADDVKMAVTEYEPSLFSYYCIGLVEETGPTDQSF